MKLDHQTWERVYPWLDKAQDVPAEDLAEWIARIVAEQPEVGVPLREVLAQMSPAEDDDAVSGLLYVKSELQSRTGQQVGAYTIDTLLAQGGMGEVWLAHRSDGQFEGKFAVKLLHWETRGAKALDRFKREGRVLARLTHPNIARLVDAGATPDGQSFLVLEYIDGEHLDSYCSSRSLATRARVRLFLDVLEAVAHAHTSLIIHRDIKPSNVLVTDGGIVKLLDFGIAKLVDPESTLEERGQLTRIEEIALTPSYAAPEQVLGEPLSTATDVYQLGVLLHVLLAGRLPRGKLDASRSDSVKTAMGDESVRVSESVSGNLRRELRGDLDAIIEKSMRNRPAERYSSAAVFAADLQRYLGYEPVSARAGLFAYRASKFVRRYRGTVVSVTAILTCLLIATVSSLTQEHKIRLERDRADQVTGFMTQIFKVADPSEARGNTVTAREILDKSSREIEAGVGLDAGVQSDLLEVMAETYANLGLYARAHGLAQSALDSRRRLLGEDNPKTLESLQQLGNILMSEGHTAEAEASFRSTLSLELQELGPKNLLTLKTQDALIAALTGKGQYVDAEQLARQTVATETATIGSRNLLTLNTTRLLATALRRQNRFSEAEALLRQTLAVQREVLGVDHPETLKTQFSFGYLLTLQGRNAEAEVVHRDVLAARRRVLGEEHPDTADTMTTIAIDLYPDRSRNAETEQLFRSALAIQLRQLGPDSRFTTRAEEGLANLLIEENRFAEAEQLLREVLRVRLKLLGPDNTDTLLTQRNLACVILASGRLDEAEQLLRVTLDRDIKVLAANDRDVFGVEYMLAETLLRAHRPAEAEVFARQAFEGQMRALGPQHPETFHGLNRLGRALAALGRYDEANALYASTIAQMASQGNQDVSQGWYAFGVMAGESGHVDEAFEHLQRAVTLGFKDVGTLRNDEELQPLRKDPRFDKLMQQM